MKTALQLTFFVIATAWLVAHIAIGNFGPRYIVTFLLALVLTAVGLLLVLKYLKRRLYTDMNSSYSASRDEILRLPMEEAEQRAMIALQDRNIFQCIEHSDEETYGADLEELPPSLRGFFEKFEALRSVFGDGVFSRGLLGPSRIVTGCIRVGESTEHTELVVRPGEDPVFEVGEGESLVNPYPSVFHWILLEDAEVREVQQDKGSPMR